MARAFDFLVIGAGVAGASAAYALSRRGRVGILEQERQAGYHSTSRSAAVHSEAYGPRTWQILTSASRAFFGAPPPGFADHSLTTPIGALFLGRREDEASLRAQAGELARRGIACALVPPEEAARLSPAVRMEDFTLGLHEPGCVGLDASAVLQGFLRLARRNGAETVLGAEALRIARRSRVWRIETAGGDVLEAPVLVNAAGAWADEVAARAGLPRRNVRPLRRTAITFEPPAGADALRWPMTFDMAETWYFKPEGRHIMASPADLIPSEPEDAQPEEIDVAVAVDRIEQATTMTIGRIAGRWAGLRTFAPDHEAVIGPDPAAPAFIWYAGQGGNGVMAAPAAGELCAALAAGEEVPAAIAALSLTAAAVSPGRLAAAAEAPSGG